MRGGFGTGGKDSSSAGNNDVDGNVTTIPAQPRFRRSQHRSLGESLGCLQCTKLGWVGKYIHITVKPTNSPNQGQPNPRKNSFKKWYLDHFFSHSKYFFRGLGLALYSKQTTTNLTQLIFPQTLLTISTRHFVGCCIS